MFEDVEKLKQTFRKRPLTHRPCLQHPNRSLGNKPVPEWPPLPKSFVTRMLFHGAASYFYASKEMK